MWIHYVGTVGLIIYFAHVTDYGRVFEMHRGGDLLDRVVVFAVFICANVFPMFSSAFCHNFYCVSKETHLFCWYFDFLGMLTGMFIGGIGHMYFAFYCQKEIAMYYAILLAVLYVVAFSWCWSKYSVRLRRDKLVPKDRFPEFSFSLTAYVCFASYIPVAVTYYCDEYTSEGPLNDLFFYAVLSPVLLSLGIVVFAQGGLPERFFGPKLGFPENFFDMVGHSHQLWHVTSATVLFNWVYVTVRHFEIRIQQSCPIS
jgi:predicted membrane channel-forming protein YqfA (hemolysin III family)